MRARFWFTLVSMLRDQKLVSTILSSEVCIITKSNLASLLFNRLNTTQGIV